MEYFKYDFDESTGEAFERLEKIEHVIDELQHNQSLLLSELMDDSFIDLGNILVHIAYDNEDDKIGRIHDAIHDAFERWAIWLVDSGNNSVTISLKRKLGIL